MCDCISMTTRAALVRAAREGRPNYSQEALVEALWALKEALGAPYSLDAWRYATAVAGKAAWIAANEGRRSTELRAADLNRAAARRVRSLLHGPVGPKGDLP